MITTMTHSGSRVNILDPDPSTISIHDIAYHLSNIRRFAGATEWSVAAHSLLTMRLVSDFRVGPYPLMWAMLHDAHKAYTGDITTPMRLLLGEGAITAIQTNLDKAIRTALGVDHYHNEHAAAIVEHLDDVATGIEMALLLDDPSQLTELGWVMTPALVEEVRQVQHRTPEVWRDKFIEHYVMLLDETLEHKTPAGVL